MKVLRKIVIFLVGLAIGYGTSAYFTRKKISNKYDNELKKINDMSKKHLDLYLMSNQWVRNCQSGKCIKEYLYNHGYKEIAIYGMSYAGETLLNELIESDIKIIYGIDKGADSIYSEIEVVKPTDKLKKVDAIVVTSITYFEEIYVDLCTKIDCPILSLEDIMYEM